ncbi:MAG: diacylglycerol kinase family lipid kinase [Chloroflexi bacterium]|nr:diacylglycerol kinase family lipid kinase [Chloroflexota bacterium]
MKVQLIHNPVAGQHDLSEQINEVISYLETQGWDVSLRRTMGIGDATTYAREAVANHYNMVIAVGGDGTFGEVATGLAYSDVTLGLIPVGTGNVWAHMLNMPTWTPLNRTALLNAAKILVQGKVRRIDLGKVDKRFFVLYGGIGLDGTLAHQVEPHREIRRNLGNVMYAVAAASLALSLRGTRMTIVIDGQVTRQRVLLVLVTNVPVYGTVWVAPQAKLDDGYLDVYIFKGENALDAMSHVIKMAMGAQAGDPRIETYRAKKIEIYGDKHLPIQLDGDPSGATPAVITVEHKALSVIVPATTSDGLFKGNPAKSPGYYTLVQRILESLQAEPEKRPDNHLL